MKKLLTILLATLLVFNSSFTSKLWAEEGAVDEEETVEAVEETVEEVSETVEATDDSVYGTFLFSQACDGFTVHFYQKPGSTSLINLVFESTDGSGILYEGDFELDGNYAISIDSVYFDDTVKQIYGNVIGWNCAAKHIYFGKNVVRLDGSLMSELYLEDIIVDSENPRLTSGTQYDFIYDVQDKKVVYAMRSALGHLPSDYEIIGMNAFRWAGYSAGTVSIAFPETLRVIEDDAFAYNSAVKSIRIPASVQDLSEDDYDNALSYAAYLSTITVDSGNLYYDSRDNCNAIIDRNNTLIAGAINSTIPSSVTAIGASAFSARGIESIIIPSNVESIGMGAFENTALRWVAISNGVTTIDNYAFSYCSLLNKVYFPSSVVSMGVDVFCFGEEKTIDVYTDASEEDSRFMELWTKSEWNELSVNLHYGYSLEDFLVAKNGPAVDVDVVETADGLKITASGEHATEWIEELYNGIWFNGNYTSSSYVMFEGPVIASAQNYLENDFMDEEVLKVVDANTLIINKDFYTGGFGSNGNKVENPNCILIDGVYDLTFVVDGFADVTVNDVEIRTGYDESVYSESEYGVPVLVDENSVISVSMDLKSAYIGVDPGNLDIPIKAFGFINGQKTDISKAIYYRIDKRVGDEWVQIWHDPAITADDEYRIVVEYEYRYKDLKEMADLEWSEDNGLSVVINGQDADVCESYYLGKSVGAGLYAWVSGFIEYTIPFVPTEKTAQEYSITYVGDFTNNPNPSTIFEDETLVLVDPVKAGYTFAGWYSDAKCTKKVTELSNVTGDVTLYVKFTPNTLVIHFDGNGATGTMKDMNLVYDKSAPLTANAFKNPGYGFAGWVDDYGNTYKDKESVLNLHDVLFAKGADITENGLVYNLHATWMILAQDVQIIYDEGNVSSETVGFEMGSMQSFQLGVDVLAEGGSPSQDVTWKSSNVKVAVVDANGNVTVTGLKGSAKITATATDGSKKSASFTVNCGHLVNSLELSGPSGVASGKSIKLTAVVGPTDATSKKVTWFTGYSSFIKVSGGKVTAAKGITEPKQVMVIAYAADGSGVVATKEITVYPASEKTSIIMNGEDITGTSVHIDPVDVQEFDLSAAILPTNASQDVTWKSSKPAILEVDENGHVTVHDSLLKSYKITVTATSSDGCKKAGKVTFVVSRYVHGLSLKSSSNVMMAGGSMMLTPEFGLVIPANQKLSWTSSDETLAKVKGGKVVALAGASGEVTITATALDGSGVSASKTITILPPAEYFAATNPFNLDYDAGYLKMTVKNASNGMVYGVEELKYYDEDEERQYLMGGDGVLRCNGQDSKGYLSLELYWDSDYMFNEFKALVDNPTNFSVKVPGKMLDYSSSTSKYVSVTYLLTFEYIEY